MVSIPNRDLASLRREGSSDAGSFGLVSIPNRDLASLRLVCVSEISGNTKEEVSIPNRDLASLRR